MRKRLATTLGTGLLAISTAAAIPSAADAAVSCTFANKVLTVRLSESHDQVALRPNNGNIGVIAVTGPIACTGGTATMTTTNTISIFNDFGTFANSVTIEDAGAFAPGADPITGENGGNPEIEMFVNLDNGANSQLSVRAGANGSAIRFGADGINPDATPGEVSPDVDIFAYGVPQFEGRTGNTAAADIGAQGGAATGLPLTKPIHLIGSNGADNLTGGNGNDTIEGLGGADYMVGGPGDDILDPDGGSANPGSDYVDGGPGNDTVDYSDDQDGGVSVDLSIAAFQPTGTSGSDLFTGVENVMGTGFADTLRGDKGPNRFTAYSGADSIDVRDGGPDTVDCGEDADTVTTDLPGIDTLLGCETTLFATAPRGSGGTTGGGTSGTSGSGGSTGTGGGPSTGAGPGTKDTVAPLFTTRPTVKRAKLRYALSEPAAVTVTIQRCRTKKHCTRVRLFGASGAAGANRTKLATLKPGSYRVLLLAVDAGGNRSKQAQASFTVPEPKRH